MIHQSPSVEICNVHFSLSACSHSNNGQLTMDNGQWMYRLRRWNSEVGASKFVPSSDEEGGEAGRREKIRKSVPFIVNSCKSKAFLSLTLRELPHQREPLTWKPLLFIIQLHFTDDANVGGQGRPPLQNRVNKQSDKLKFDKDNESACRRNGTRPFPTNKLDGLCICRKCIRVMKVQTAP